MAQAHVHQIPGQGGGGGQPPPKRPPRKNPYHDGHSQCAQYYDLYEMIRRPNAHLTHRPPDPPPKKESARQLAKKKQKKIEKELEKRFENNNYRLPGNRFALIGKWLKFLFLSLTLPPYILFYEGPKKIFFQKIPAFCDKVDQFFIRLGNRFKARIQKRVDRLLNFAKNIKRLWQKTKAHKEKKVETAEEEALDFLSFLLEGVWILYRTTIRPPIRFCIWLFHASLKTAKGFKNSPEKVEKFFKTQTKKVQTLTVKKVSQLASWIKKKAKEKISPVNTWIKRQQLRLETTFMSYCKRVAAAISKFTEGVKNLALRPIQTIRKWGQTIRKKFKEVINPLTNKLKARFLKQKAFFLEKKNGWFKTISKPLKQAVSTLKRKIAHLLSFRPNFRFKKVFPFTGKSFKIQILQNRKWVQPFSKIQRAMTSLGKGLQNQLKRIKFKLPKIKPFINLTKYKKHLSYPFQKIWHPIRKVLTALYSKWKKVSRRLQLIKIWAKILIRHGMKLVKQSAQAFNLKN